MYRSSRASQLACICARTLGGCSPGNHSLRVSQLPCVIARVHHCSLITEGGGPGNRSTRRSQRAYNTARVYHCSQIRRERGPGNQSPRRSQLARIIARALEGRRTTKPWLACIVAQAYLCSQIRAGEDPPIMGRVYQLARITARVYHCPQIMGGGGGPGNHSSRRSQLARNIARELRRREDSAIKARVNYGPRAS